MKIKYAIHSCDSNPMYYEFWPLVSKVWKELLDIEPILIFVGDEIPKEVAECEYGKVIQFTPIKDIPTATQSQFIRLWYTQKFPNDVVITSDIDMFPLSKNYFKYQISKIPDDKFIFFSFNGRDGEYNICYNAATGNTFKEVLELDDTFENILLKAINEMDKGGHNKWFLDEYYLTEKLNEYKGDKYIKLSTRNSIGRIDRAFWTYKPGELKLGMYVDCHSLRPYPKYKFEIDKLLNELL
jgi:hypothetical protein